MKTVLGKPKYKYNDQVSFKWNETIKTGRIHIVDSYGTFFQTEEPSYDVMVEDGEPCLYKHIPESYILSNVT